LILGERRDRYRFFDARPLVAEDVRALVVLFLPADVAFVAGFALATGTL
jgi:hypothetical protein